ncbi:2696_t:CDS:2 [Diversispora eburnea]|uniref:2696_t:CDS:1 n=1 Tax=Diversispora eburnea TaxID=1213867 RepID=A0A9N8VAY7_9GLOM|nr:2696_t:CDS:2 [Diversispora eburnea]
MQPITISNNPVKVTKLATAIPHTTSTTNDNLGLKVGLSISIVPYVNTYGNHNYDDMTKLKRLKLPNNRIEELNLTGSSNIECNNNLLTELQCEIYRKKYFSSKTTTTSTSKRIQPTTTIKHLATATPITDNNLGLKIGLSVVEIIAISWQDKEQEAQELENADEEIY